MRAAQGVASIREGVYIDVHNRADTEQQRGNAKYIRRFLLYCACSKLTLNLRKLYGDNFGNALFLHGYAEEGVRLVHRRLSVRDNDELRTLRETL